MVTKKCIKIMKLLCENCVSPTELEMKYDGLIH